MNYPSDLTNVVLNCDCRMKWLLRKCRDCVPKITGNPICSKPTSLHGRRFRKLSRNQLKCKENYPIFLR